MIPELEIEDEEVAAGFTVQTLVYPDAYELPIELDDSLRRYERAIAICIDDSNRIRRRRSGSGYVHERNTESGWLTAVEFESLSDVLCSTLYSEWRDRQNEQDHGRAEEHANDEA